MPDRPRHIIVLAHPDPGSLNAAIAHAYAETVAQCGQDATIRDLYTLDFDPVLRRAERPDRRGFTVADDVREELSVIRRADVYALVYPIWFGMPPAILTGYIDRVLGTGATEREVQHHEGEGVLRGKRLLSITTAGAPELWLDEQGQIESLKTVMGRYLFHAFGMRSADHLQFGGVVEGLPEQVVEGHLEEVRARARHLCGQLADEYALARART